MPPLKRANPITTAFYFLFSTLAVMICGHPIMLLTAAAGALCLFFCECGKGSARRHFGMAAFFVMLAAVNPLFSHKGVTVLFVMNDRPVTLEALLYGVFSALLIVAILYLFSVFSSVMTEDRLLYLFSFLSSKAALTLSLSLRYIPMMIRKAQKIDRAQRALGLYRNGSFLDLIRSKIRVFSILVTWSLEHGVVTAESMASRGYGTGKRSFYKLYRFTVKDLFSIIWMALLFGLPVVLHVFGYMDFAFYPVFTVGKLSLLSALGFFSYAFLVFLPVISEIVWRVKWNFLRSKI